LATAKNGGITNSNRVLFSTDYKFQWSSRPAIGDNIWGVGIDGLDPKLLSNWSPTPKHASVSTVRRIRASKDRIVKVKLIDLLKHDDKNVLVAAYKKDAKFAELHKMNVETGEHAMVGQAPVENAGFLVDKKSVVRFAIGSGSDNTYKTYYRADETAEWRLINDEALSRKALYPVAFGHDNNYVYLQSEESSGPDAIYKFDVASQTSSLFLRDNNVDPSGLELSPIDGSLYAISFIDGYPRYEFVDNASPYVSLPIKWTVLN
jgi:hypothetical protein